MDILIIVNGCEVLQDVSQSGSTPNHERKDRHALHLPQPSVVSAGVCCIMKLFDIVLWSWSALNNGVADQMIVR